MRREVSVEELQKIKEQVLDTIARDRPDLVAEGADPAAFTAFKQELMLKAAELAASTPEMASGGPIKRFLKGGWRSSIGGLIDTAGTIGQMALDAPENWSRQSAAAREAVMSGDVLGALKHSAQAMPIAGPLGTAIVNTQLDQFKQAGELWDQGEYNRAIGYGVGGTVPLAGPALTAAGERIRSGDIAGGLGEAAGLFVPLKIPKVLQKPHVPGLGRFIKRANVGDAAVIERAMAEGLDVDLATATGNATVKAMQRIGGESIGGSVPVTIMTGRAERRFKNAAEQRAAAATGLTEPVTKVEAGEKALSLVREKKEAAFAAGREKYSDADMYAALADEEWVPKSEQILDPARQARAEHTLGHGVTVEQAQELRRIAVEMERGFQGHIGVEIPTRHGGDTETVAGSAGAKVFDDIVGAMEGHDVYDLKAGETRFKVTNPTRKEVLISLRRALATGDFTGPARAAMEVVKERLARPTGQMEKNADLPKSAGVLMEERKLPVDTTEPYDMLKRVYEDEQKLRQAVGNPSSNPAFEELARFMEGPRVLDATVLDKVLSNFKRLARKGKEVRDPNAAIDPGQRLAILAERAIEPTLAEKAKTVPGFYEALQEGRKHWKEGFEIKQVEKQLTKTYDPQNLFLQLTGPGGTRKLRELKTTSPDAIPYLAKAKLDWMNQQAFSGKSTGPGAALRMFEAMPKETLAVLFPQPGHVQRLHDLYKVMALRAENVNPSGTFLTAAKYGEVTGLFGALAGVLSPGTPGASTVKIAAPILATINTAMGLIGHSSRITKVLLQGKNIPIKNTAAIASWAHQLDVAVKEEQQRQKQQEASQGQYPGIPADIPLPAEAAPAVP